MGLSTADIGEGFSIRDVCLEEFLISFVSLGMKKSCFFWHQDQKKLLSHLGFKTHRSTVSENRKVTKRPWFFCPTGELTCMNGVF